MISLECPRCGGEIKELSCQMCGRVFGKAGDLVFLGDFEPDDALGLVEIAASAETPSEIALDSVDVVDGVCAAYHRAENKEAFSAANEIARHWYFPFRYNEWLTMQRLLAGIDLNQKHVLDIGAGLGYDSQRLSKNGATVTALEFNPVLANTGMRAFPHIRWIGGFSHALPFRTADFDAVFINAALHHMRDVPAAIAEALRVLKPGGVLITSSDPFRSDQTPASHELEIFDRHEAALSGINEGIPRFSDFVSVLQDNADILDVEIFTTALYGQPDIMEWHSWRLADAEMLRQRAGSIGLRVKLKAEWPHTRHLQKDGILSPEAFYSWLREPATAISRLAAHIPDRLANTKFPGEPSKYDLLNGWRLENLTKTSRVAYKRGRWLLRRDASHTLSFKLSSPQSADFTVFLDGHEVSSVFASSLPVEVVVDLRDVPIGKKFIIEIRRSELASDFDENCFCVADRRLHKPTLIERLIGTVRRKLAN